MIPDTRYAFFGSPDFAAIILERLIEAGLPPALVVCNPDRPTGRKQVITPPPTKVIAEKHGIEVLQPENLQNTEYLIQNTKYDLFIVAAYSKILPKEIITIPRLGTIGVHPSLLPKYRGATPIQSAILAGEEKTGVTLFLIDEKVDHGPIVSSIKYKVLSEDTYETLMEKLAEMGGNLLVDVLPKFVKGGIEPVAQNETEATYTKKFTTEDGYVDLAQDDPAMIERKIRALNPEPGVWTMMDGVRTKLLEAEIAGGKLKLKVIQKAGKKPQKIS